MKDSLCREAGADHGRTWSTLFGTVRVKSGRSFWKTYSVSSLPPVTALIEMSVMSRELAGLLAATKLKASQSALTFHH